MKRFVLISLLTLMAGLAPAEPQAQVAVKTNVVSDALLTPTLGAEVAFGRRHSANLVYAINPWKYNEGKMARHWTVMPEYRWWKCVAYDGLFFGVHAMGGEFNAAKVDIPLPGFMIGGNHLLSRVRDNRIEGAHAGAGFTCGYQWSLSRHFNIEAEVGVGYNHVWWKEYPCAVCGMRKDKGEADYIGITKIGLSLMYIF